MNICPTIKLCMKMQVVKKLVNLLCKVQLLKESENIWKKK